MFKKFSLLALGIAVATTFSPEVNAATINGFTVGSGVTEGNNQNRRTVVGTTDENKDAGTIDLATLEIGEIFGIYGRIVSAVDRFTFAFEATGAFEIAFDLDGYDVYKTGDGSGANDNDPSNIETVAAGFSGLVNQSFALGEDQSAGKDVKFSLFKGGVQFGTDQIRTTNVVAGASDAERILFQSNEAGSYLLRIDGMNEGTAALYDINISGFSAPDPTGGPDPVPLPAGMVLIVSGIAGLGLMRRRKASQ